MANSAPRGAHDSATPDDSPSTSTVRIIANTRGLPSWLITGSIEWGAFTVLALALGYVMHEETDSAIWLGLQVAALTLPYTLFSLSMGRALDLFERRRLLLIAYGAEIVLAIGVGVLYEIGSLNRWYILLASLIFGVILTFEVPANWMVIQDYAPPERLTNVIAISSTASNIAIAMFMIAGGAILATVGFGGVCLGYVVAAAPVLIVIWKQPKTSPPKPVVAHDTSSAATGLRTTVRVARRNRRLYAALILTPIIGCLFLPILGQMPALADWLGGEAFLTGALAGAAYFGAAAVAPTMGWVRRRGARLGPTVMTAMIVGAVAMAVAGILGEEEEGVGRILLVLPALFLIGCALTVVTVVLTSTVQMAAPEALRGHFLGLSGLMLDGLLPITSVLWGIAIQFSDFGFSLAIAAVLLGIVIIFHRSRRNFAALDQAVVADN
ncbi:MFS transporter [Candidatus Nanopelagicales bacterium]|nr:MFS transporter [Candidatus Nanopelagicales bacterium]